MEPPGITSEADRLSKPEPTGVRQRGRAVALLLFLWIVIVSFTAQGGAWLAPVLGRFAESGAARLAFAATVVQGLALLLPLLPLALLWPAPRYRAVFRAWLFGTAFLLALAPARLLPPTEGQLIVLLQVTAAGLYLVIVAIVTARTRRTAATIDFGSTASATQKGPPTATIAFPLAIATGILFAYPWLAWGSLGSPLDIVLVSALAALTGLAAGFLVARWLEGLNAASRGQRGNAFTGGLVVGAALLIMASGLSFNGAQLPLMLALPALGWAAVGIARLARPQASRWGLPVVAVIIGLSAAAPLLFTDPDGMAIIVLDPILRWAFLAALVSVAIAWLAGIAIGLTTRRPVRRPAGAVWAVPLVALVTIGVMIYATGGQTGSHGDELFVILEDQADLSGAPAHTDYDGRRRVVYETLVRHAETSQADLRATLKRFGISYTPYYLVNALEVHGGLLLRFWLATRPEVDRVLPSPVLRPPQKPPSQANGRADRPSVPEWNLTSIGADRVWRELGISGKGIVVGQSDSGAQFDHPELAPGYRGRNGDHNYNWYDPWNGTTAPDDTNGHGTHTLGSILGQSVGVAPGATWFACANLPRNLGNPARYLDCMQFMLAPFPQGGDPFRDGDPTRSAHVVNNSWGCPQDMEGCDPGSLLPAVRALNAAGIFVVASGGNDGPACSTLTDPIAIYGESFTVGAVDEAEDLASFSSRGPVTVDGSGRTKPDILAPGVDILSAFPGSTYQRESGTSMAGPHVTGVVALMWSANPGLIGDIPRTKEILVQSATPFTGTLSLSLPGACSTDASLASVPNNVAGYGVVDAYKAVKMALDQKQ